MFLPQFVASWIVIERTRARGLGRQSVVHQFLGFAFLKSRRGLARESVGGFKRLPMSATRDLPRGSLQTNLYVAGARTPSLLTTCSLRGKQSVVQCCSRCRAILVRHCLQLRVLRRQQVGSQRAVLDKRLQHLSGFLRVGKRRLHILNPEFVSKRSWPHTSTNQIVACSIERKHSLGLQSSSVAV